MRAAVGPLVAGHEVAVHPKHVEGDIGDGDLPVSVQHPFAHEWPVGRAYLVERDEFAVEHEATNSRRSAERGLTRLGRLRPSQAGGTVGPCEFQVEPFRGAPMGHE